MGRRSRKRGGAVQTAAPAPAPSARRPERPRAPWHPVPLVEMSVLTGLLLLVAGLLRLGKPGGGVLLVCGTALASLGGLDTALREHFSGFRSHAVLLAALPAVAVAGVLFFAKTPWLAIPVVALAVFAAVLLLARRAFRRRG
jgi:hypothetical protein